MSLLKHLDITLIETQGMRFRVSTVAAIAYLEVRDRVSDVASLVRGVL